MIQYKAFEMHTHTLHSDGKFTPEELCRTAEQYQFDGIALTDHNTLSAHAYLSSHPDASRIPVVEGIEWTTFFGHMLVLGAESYVDWRYAKPADIDFYLEKIRNVNGVIGLAHPFEIGSPMCTGCHWDFQVRDWNNINYIEVWSKSAPTTHFDNALSFRMWTQILNQGYRIAATAGRDWHWETETRAHAAATYIGVENGEITTRSVCDAIRAGRTYVTAGPAIDFKISAGQRTFAIGDTMPSGICSCRIEIDETKRKAIWGDFGIDVSGIRIVSNGNVIYSSPEEAKMESSFNLELKPGWVRAELYGNALGETGKRIGFTSPIYVE